jgi:hypothetical protein
MRAFLKALDDAASRTPLCDFFAARESTRREEVIFSFVLMQIVGLLENLRNNLKKSATMTLVERLALASSDEISESIFTEFIAGLALKARDPKIQIPKDDILGALNQLLGRLDATVRKALVETPSDFVIKFDSSGNPEHTEEMTMAQFFDAIEKQWSEEHSGEVGATSGELRQRAELNRKKSKELLARFLGPA